MFHYIDTRLPNQKNDKKLRTLKMGDFTTDTDSLRFIKENGMYYDFIESINNSRNSKPGWLNSFRLKVNNTERITHNGVEYILLHNDSKDYTEVHKILPTIFDDETFNWKYNNKYETQEATVVVGLFEFTCYVRKDTSAWIDVRYAKCDNKHRNKVTITTIKIDENADNDTILDSIRQWGTSFSQEVGEITGVA